MGPEIVRLVQGLPPVTLAIVVAWLVTMISVPVLAWVGGDRARTLGVSAGVVLQAGAVLAIIGPVWGLRETLRMAGTILLIGWLAEFVGSHTGFPFGRYHYTQRLQPQLGRVPVLIPLAWLMMLPPAWAVGWATAARTEGPTELVAMVFAVMGALAFTVWDLFLDPQMVRWHLWVWEPIPAGHRHYFGVPWSNYLGWFLVSALITWLAAPLKLPWDEVRLPLLGIYGLTWVLETIGQLVFWRLPGPAIAGALGMGMCLAWALL